MTVHGENKDIIIIPSEVVALGEQLKVFTLPSPSNNSSKGRVELFQVSNNLVYQIKNHSFSKGSKINNNDDMANDVYHYTRDNETLKSVILTNEQDRSEAYLRENGSFKFALKYDIVYNLIGFYYSESITESEKEYSNQVSSQSGKEQGKNDRFLTLRDYHDLLVDSNDSQWANISLEVLKIALEKISNTVEEAEDIYYKIDDNKILEFLAKIVSKIASNLPKSIPPLLPNSAPEDIQNSMKIVLATNILISLVPKKAYLELIKFKGTDNTISIDTEVKKFNDYLESNELSIEEKKLLMQAAISVGMNNDSSSDGKDKNKTIKKPIVPKKPRVAVGRGAIDGFFKKK
ncbi:hypothetical protein Kpol_1051p11 [Vanderwaltozyma polyspora DSM 70294]|uniref:Ribonuclease H2 subunit B n=1 Tax=Vanderwaltozyma polyspora (strain ATCC 22028 / DSM 70294 / BCRC 21397 / CBS 2163 / NBRC 10782 / NRRL Y-8283 / UCD 57-17) TaxID=436907 RepID=A7TMX5_VANPO|nr:uncharacterized protein Kpol_1051p11 [Vanderwaltozyma polyspora DSM 70294]EDO16363.1 hypothetical protein Kpol_1051p11 [Vanderwaltozyma polyspora DSM 70294]